MSAHEELTQLRAVNAELLAACQDALEASETGTIYQQRADGESSQQAAKRIAKMETLLRAAIAAAERRQT